VLPRLLEAALLYRIATADISQEISFSHIADDGEVGGQSVFALCSVSSNSMKSANPKSGIYEATTTRTLDGNGGNPSCNQGGMLIVETGAKAIHESIGGDSISLSDISYTLRSGRKPMLVEQVSLSL